MKTFTKLIRKTLFFLTALSLTSCGPMVRSQVTRFSELPANGIGKTFIIIPLQNQIGDLEYQTYANQIADQLEKAGYSTTNSLRNADYSVAFAYSISEPSTVTGTAPIIGQTGGGYSYQNGNFSSVGSYGSAFGTFSGSTYTTPTYGVVGESNYSITTYTRELALKMFDLHQSTATQLHTSFQGDVISVGPSNSFAQVAPCLISSLFKKFPGNNGVPLTISLPLSHCVN